MIIEGLRNEMELNSESTMKINIRTAEINDAGSIAILTTHMGYEKGIINTRERIESILKNEDNCFFVALQNDEIVAWIHAFYTMRIESDFFVEIGGLVVDERYRRRGIASLLVDQVLLWARYKKNDRVRIRTNTIRKEAHAFYRYLGFRETKEQKVFDMQLD